jgi:hypothetical protein
VIEKVELGRRTREDGIGQELRRAQRELFGRRE